MREMARPYKVSIGLSQDAWDLIQENIEKGQLSAFVDELLIESLQDKKFWKARIIRHIEQLRFLAQRAGLEVEIGIKEVLKPVSPVKENP